MKNIKKMLAFVVVMAMVLTCAFALVACQKHECKDVCPDCNKCKTDCTDPACAEKCDCVAEVPHTCGHKCPDCGKCTDLDCADPVCEDKCAGHGGTPTPDHVCGHKCPDCGKCLDEACTDEACADKCLGHKRTITLVVEGEDDRTYETGLDGIIDFGTDGVPVPTTKEHWSFLGWYSAATGGTSVDIRTAFTKDTTLYARIVRDDGIWSGDGETLISALIVNTGAKDNLQYWLGSGKSIELEKGDTMSIYIDGNLITFTYKQFGSISCVDTPSDTQTQRTSVTVMDNAAFVIYVDQWSDTGNWTAEFTGRILNIDETSEIPEGCQAITISYGTDYITLYMVDKDGNAINKDNASNFQIHGWGGPDSGNLFGAWDNNPTLDAGMEGGAGLTFAHAINKESNLMIHWAGGQTAGFANMECGHTYVVWLADQDDPTNSVTVVKKYIPAAD